MALFTKARVSRLKTLQTQTDAPFFGFEIEDGYDVVHLARRLSNVIRMSRLYIQRKQNVATHTYNVLVMLDMILEEFTQEHTDLHNEAFQIMRYALHHDLDEGITGDIPYDVKMHCGVKQAIDKAVVTMSDGTLGALLNIGDDIETWGLVVVAYVDMAELALTLIEEIEMGNRHADTCVVFNRAKCVMGSLWQKLNLECPWYKSSKTLCSIHSDVMSYVVC